MWHHVIPRHEWRTRFGNLKGCNSKDNVVWLTLEQHIQVHDFLFELYGRLEDKWASGFLSGRIGKENIIREICRQNQKKAVEYWKTHTRKKWSKEAKSERSQMLKGNKHTKGHKLTDDHIRKCTAHLRGNKYALGMKHTEEWKRESSLRSTGRKLSWESKQLISKAAKERWKLWRNNKTS